MSSINSSKLDKAVGKLLIARLPGLELTDDWRQILEAGFISGFTLFKENAQSLEQLILLARAIHRHYDGTPLLAVDQEGGAVQRFDHLLTPLPSPMALAAQGNLNTAKTITKLSCEQLKQIGVNCIFSPGLDLSNNAYNPIICTRSFGTNPQLVAVFGEAVSSTIESSGLMSVGKHFPGHGDTAEDSHSNLAVNRSSRKTLSQRELVPFSALANKVSAMMIGHIWLPSIDQSPLPASLSANIINGMLREDLHFHGLCITDDLTMKAVSDRLSLPEAAIQSVLAGNDQLLTLGTMDDIISIHKALVKAVQEGLIEEQALARSVARVDQSRQRLYSDPRFKSGSDLPLQAMLSGLETSVKLAQPTSLDASRKAISLVKGQAPHVSSGQWMVIAPELKRFRIPFADFLKSRTNYKPVSIIERRYTPDTPDDEREAIANFACNQDLLFLTYRLHLNPGQMQLSHDLAKAAKTRTVIVIDAPYDLARLTDWENQLATFDPSDQAMEALALALTDKEQLSGSVPVSLV